LDLLPLEIALKGADPLLSTVALSSGPVVLCVKPHLGLAQVVFLLEPLLLLELTLEIEDLLAGLDILLT
jgi:hypothetical protein